MISTSAKGAKYICDCCGKAVFVKQIRKENMEEPGSFMVSILLPEGWARNEDGTIVCEECAEK